MSDSDQKQPTKYEQIRAMMDKATQGHAEFTTFTMPDGSMPQTNEDVAKITTFSAMQSESAELWGVTVVGDGPIICYTGNGPTSRENARYITWALNNREKILSTITPLSAENLSK